MSKPFRSVIFVLCLLGLMVAIAAQARGGGNNLYLPIIVQSSPYWALTYDVNEYDRFESIKETNDGGFVAVGGSHTFGEGEDAWVVKLNLDGTIAWEKGFAGVGDQFFDDVQEAQDGTLYLAGGNYSEITQSVALWVVKLDGQGNVIWQKSYGEFVGNGFVEVTDDGGLLVTGLAFGPDIRVLKLDSNGGIVWQRTVGSSRSDHVVAIYETNDNGYILGGQTYTLGPSQHDALVVKLNEDGSIAWQRTYGSAGVDLISAMQITDDDGVILVGTIDSIGSSQGNVWVIKLNNMGLLEWQKFLGGPSSDRGNAVQQTSDGGYVVAGLTFSYGLFPSNPTDGDAWLLKLDFQGNVVWQKTYGGYGGDEVDTADSIEETSEGDLIVAGSTESFDDSSGDNKDGWVLKLDSLGNIPNCGIIGISTAVPAIPPIISAEGLLAVTTSTSSVEDTTIIPQNSTSRITSACNASAHINKSGTD